MLFECTQFLKRVYLFQLVHGTEDCRIYIKVTAGLEADDEVGEYAAS